MRTLGALLSLLLVAHTEGSGHGWTYPEGPEGEEGAWSNQYPTCAGEQQSPINIQTNEVLENKALRPLKLRGYGHQEGEFLLVNNGHSVQLSLPSTMQIVRGLSHIFTAVQAHFHWGGKTGKSHGSEHTVNGAHYDSEMHIVHYNSDQYSSSDEAQGKPDGLAVLAVFLQAKKGHKNAHFEKIISHLSEIQNVGENVTLNSIDIKHLLPDNLSKYYRYNGSLTTPPCSENVTWMILKETVTISKKQLDKLQNSVLNSNHETLQNNFREVKPLNHRRVEANFPTGKGKESRSKPEDKNKEDKRR